MPKATAVAFLVEKERRSGSARTAQLPRLAADHLAQAPRLDVVGVSVIFGSFVAKRPLTRGASSRPGRSR